MPQVTIVDNTAKRPRVTLALGGGGGRGISHLGVLKAVTEQKLVVDRVCGISIGAIAAALYATKSGVDEVCRDVLQFVNSPQFVRHQLQMFGASRATSRVGMVSGWLSRFKKIYRAHRSLTRAVRHSALLPHSVLQHVVETLLPDIGIEEANLPLSIVAVDLKRGERVVLERGPLRDAVRASASIPGIFPPVRWRDRLLCDIGFYESVPVISAKQYGSEMTIAVDVSEPVASLDQCHTILDVFSRMHHLAEHELRHHSLREADLIIRPEIGLRPWFDFSRPEALIDFGYQAAKETLGRLHERTKPAAAMPDLSTQLIEGQRPPLNLG